MMAAVVVVVIAIVVFAITTASAHKRGRALIMWGPPFGPPPGQTSSALFNVQGHEPASFGDYDLCLTHAGPAAHITSVEPVGGNGRVSVTAFAVRPNPERSGKDQLGALNGPLARWGFRLGEQDVGAVCSRAGVRSEELGVQLSTPGGIGSLRWLRVDYTIDGSERSFLLPGAIALCPGKHGGPRCRVRAS